MQQKTRLTLRVSDLGITCQKLYSNTNTDSSKVLTKYVGNIYMINFIKYSIKKTGYITLTNLFRIERSLQRDAEGGDEIGDAEHDHREPLSAREAGARPLGPRWPRRHFHRAGRRFDQRLPLVESHFNLFQGSD